MTASIVRDSASAAFYDGTARGEFLLRHCPSCETHSAPQAIQCTACSSTELGWSRAEGAAILISWTVGHDRSGTVTTIAGLVELTEGPWIRTRITGVSDPSALATGMALHVAFEPVDGAETVPVFRVTA